MQHTVTTLEVKAQNQPETELESRSVRVGLLGGTFNPPHLGHLVIGEQVARQLELEKVYFMPNAIPPHVDHKEAIAAVDRVKMVQAAIQGNSLFDFELAEVERGGISYAYDTLLTLVQKHPNYEYYFIIGADEVAYLPTWHRIDELMQLTHFVGVNRPGVSAPKSEFPIQFVTVPDLDISSTDLRQKIAHHESVRYLVPDLVAAYIFEKGLYQDDDRN
ncbi:nadD protein [Weissella kandleri]|uniref:Probable nicotinate-nucleotide adenylyltransferase n=1 Tax=Weissella kandleri TaxID=1616 RepID=A0A0R2JDP1_9LACO|nr:nicotinate-nucleotide adenylyltransferase [Weissella kandleri]KRN75475.1 nadD protein [Weissella kandleri]